MQAVVWCRIGDDSLVSLGHGDVIGRMGAAALVVDDARVSEAHAIVSLRGGALHLLALRGRFRVHGQVRAEVEIHDGLQIELAEGLLLTIHRVSLPPHLLGVEGQGLPPQVLGGTTSFFLAPTPSLRKGWAPEAQVWFWNVDQDWRAQVQGEQPRPWRQGDTLQVQDYVLRAVPISLRAASVPRTRQDLAPPLHLSACVNTVQISVDREAPVVIGGLPGRLLAELIAFEGPVSWDVVAGELWSERDPGLLRRRWDVTLSRLRNRLRALGARDDLIAADGAGQIELVLRPQDAVTLRDG
ncbi:MAG: FHA domain-containing protein [Deltaproteobacteria bacterium]|nr:MAG: FHA domain-containing protein [Deltaproteobacteria bacterium]